MTGGWIREQRRVYLGNAGSVREYRTQLRGSRAPWLWAVYLLIFILLVGGTYAALTAEGTTSVAAMQDRLAGFYGTVIYLLEAMVALIAPLLASSSLVAEYQRRSIDLVMSAPVSPKYLLVGKLLSGYRYIWMLLVLALPAASVCVVLGGATWSEVLIAYVIVSIHALMYLALSMPIAAVYKRMAPTVLASYAAVIGLAMTTAALTGPSLGSMGSAAGQHMPFTAVLSPFLTPMVSDTYMTIGRYDVPNWILAGIFAAIFCRIMMLGAGSHLSPAGSVETRWLRILAVPLLYALAWVIALLVKSLAGASWAMLAASVPLLIPAPFLATFSYMGERKYFPDGVFNIRRILTGTPSGNLPFLVLAVSAIIAGVYFAPGGFSDIDLVHILWIVALWAFVWACGWVASAYSKGSIEAVRKAHLALVFGFLIFPMPFISILEWTTTYSGSTVNYWTFAPISGVYFTDIGIVSAQAAVLFVCAVVMAIIAEQKWRQHPAYGLVRT